MENELAPVEVLEITEQQPQQAALLDTSVENILQLAERADRYIEAMNKIMQAALRVTSEHDWVLIGGKPYLQESGSTKVARLFGVSIKLIGEPKKEKDLEGFVTYTYTARFMLGNQFVECEGSRSMKEDFFSRSKGGKKKPDEIDERDVRLAAYTNCLNNGIKRLIPGLRNIQAETLESAGFDLSRIGGYTFKSGSRGGSTGSAEDSGITCSKCGTPVSQKVASYSQSKHGAILCMTCQKG